MLRVRGDAHRRGGVQERSNPHALRLLGQYDMPEVLLHDEVEALDVAPGAFHAAAELGRQTRVEVEQGVEVLIPGRLLSRRLDGGLALLGARALGTLRRDGLLDRRSALIVADGQGVGVAAPAVLEDSLTAGYILARALGLISQAGALRLAGSG
jgi:hypothetical protein